MRLIVSTVFVVSVLPSFALSKEKLEVSIEVKTADGKPSRGAVAGHMWRFTKYRPDHPFSRIPKDQKANLDGPMAHINELYAPNGIAADDDGVLSFAIAPSDLPTTYFVMSQDRREGAILTFALALDFLLHEGTSLRLEKMAKIQLDIKRPLPGDPKQSFVALAVIHNESGSNIYYSRLDCSSKQAEVTTELRLPPGQYRYGIQSDGSAMHLRDLVIDDKQAGQEVRIEASLTPKFIRTFAGRVPPPLCTTGSVGTISRKTIEKHRGRPLLLVFFQTGGCGPPVEVRRLFDLYRDLEPVQRDKRLLIHCVRGVRDEKDYQTQVMDPIKREQKEIDFSVPVLLDGDLCTIRTWGLDQFPTAVLLNKDGRVVEQGSPWTLWDRVDSPEP